ncbi:MAG: filamentous hemagglutinin N-terminal domain-containing protein, partial [Desulfobacterales bacterium]|nr:filamentous hemagglutinin N-terminal domain-containing protein [Desulfobacterales bacterium]
MRKNLLKRRISALMLIYMVCSLVFPVHIFALPKGGTVVAGSAGITQPDQLNMQVNQATDKAIINWQQFSIAHQEAVRFLQPGAASIALNRVTGGDLSAIHGLLSANGRIFVINPNGIMVGPTGRIETNSFLGSTLDMSNEDFLSGNYVFIQNPGASLASILNQGIISAADGGSVSLLAPGVVNQGSIIANLGKVNLGAGEKITLNFSGNDLINFIINESVKNQVLGVDGAPLENGVLNEGRITADGGEVVLSAKVAYDAIKSVVNNRGVIEAKTLENKNGVIKLNGGDEGITYNSGTLDASGEDEGETGGTIEVTGRLVGLTEYAKLRASGRSGGGKINVGGGFQGKDEA